MRPVDERLPGGGEAVPQVVGGERRRPQPVLGAEDAALRSPRRPSCGRPTPRTRGRPRPPFAGRSSGGRAPPARASTNTRSSSWSSRTHVVQQSTGPASRSEDDELGLADRDRAGRAGPLGLAGGLVGAQRRADVERQALVDRAGDAQGRAVLAHLLDELRAEHAHAGDPLVEAQVAAAGEVGVVLRAGEREGAAAHQRLDPRAQGAGCRRAGSVATSGRPATRRRSAISSRAGTAWRGGFTSGDYRRRPRERSSQAPRPKPRGIRAEARMGREERA